MSTLSVPLSLPNLVRPARTLEDPLTYLSCSSVLDFRKGEPVYHQDQPNGNLYLIIDGEVQVSRITASGKQVVYGLYQPDEFFGEAAVLRLPASKEQAVALKNSTLMAWTDTEIEQRVENKTRLGIALLQILIQRNMDFAIRFESFGRDTIPERLARALVRFAERRGTVEVNGWVRMGPIMHQTLGGYIGTSRELTTHYMNQFRKEGRILYTQKVIRVFPEALQDVLRNYPR